MSANDTATRHYALVEAAIRHLRAHAHEQPTLEDLARAVHLSPGHLQRVFSEWAGVSPKRFLQYLSKQHALSALATSQDMLSVTHALGLSSGSRLHELMVTCEAMTPGEIRAGGQGVTVGYGWGPSPFGGALIGWTTRGVCHLAFAGAPRAELEARLATAWPRAALRRDDAAARAWLERVFAPATSGAPLPLLLKGSNFQLKVWEALLDTGCGRLVSYRQLAGMAGAPRAARAVGSALAANDLAYLIPCHRVIREGGEVGQYRWGGERKQAIQLWEAARLDGDGC
ncbi:methylated-DNA--[protein]-cysteine S-methyltransferase [Crenobacter caeni]|uniref:Methylated-DNA--[protein]-cysteine S-methyltransferase n=1 Tax=Crenobacter caeni TaxID=2705474 RepID=A0A6B2KUE0_9NEIS|nr:methylated-DNA--[protein]-cysteine S-methyltransferase [Crenobacter caeni]NDV13619.1 methylated-DNA--[protein]-cysteine S-methyltransferase [Crenobacter caeni]